MDLFSKINCQGKNKIEHDTNEYEKQTKKQKTEEDLREQDMLNLNKKNDWFKEEIKLTETELKTFIVQYRTLYDKSIRSNKKDDSNKRKMISYQIQLFNILAK